MTKTLVVNLFAPSGAGKSSGMAYIFSMLKMRGVNCEMAPEFAKEKCWEENKTIFKSNNQVYIFGKQYYIISRLLDKVDVVITDSPLLLSNIYNTSEILKLNFENAVRDCFSTMPSLNYLVKRTKPFNPAGRNQKTVEESDEYLPKILDELDKNRIEYRKINGDIQGYNRVVEDVIEYLENINNSEKNKDF